MELYYSTLITTIIAFLLYVFYYKILFLRPMQEEIKKAHPKTFRKPNYYLWFGNFINIFILALVYATLGYTFDLFPLAPATTPYILSLLIWLMFTAVLIMSSSRTKQSQIITFLHSGFLLTILLLFAIVFPFLMSLTYPFTS